MQRLPGGVAHGGALIAPWPRFRDASFFIYLDLQNARNHGPYTAYTLCFDMLSHCFWALLEVQVLPDPWADPTSRSTLGFFSGMFRIFSGTMIMLVTIGAPRVVDPPQGSISFSLGQDWQSPQLEVLLFGFSQAVGLTSCLVLFLRLLFLFLRSGV